MKAYDPSNGLIRLARQRLPEARFAVADVLKYRYPDELDVVYGFASFLHLNRDDFAVAGAHAAAALRTSGVLLMTLKEREAYAKEMMEDEFGQRMFYYYNEATVRELTAGQFELAWLEHQTLSRKTAQWLAVGLRKR